MTEQQIAYLKYFTCFFGNAEVEQKQEVKTDNKEKHGWY